ncbi:uncharacterized protein LOC118738966 [Rhagoletis pomonella]|uniref:uncharacterized protein LOC118738966 n=1 Tax=Rhagoletis pomonella TaxID=28610 RepID=UPI00177F64AA|nr:uncharacterized protein LOC118738966 [Rhagoletis pomonella]
MPRVNDAHARDTNGSDAIVAPKARKNAIKAEVESPGEQLVFHRKSERRRVARDIFLVFEEQPCRRVRGGANRKKAAQKPKFGHLMVEDPSRSTKGLLRDIKNEPKCYLADDCTTTPAVATTATITKNDEKHTPKVNNCIESKPIVVVEKPPEPIKEISSDDPVARVNPIFLWVKQDDTRIVEVRCEDYDKRNRIRITKTSNGWRAIPRTDPSSSKIVKIFQTPLLKVKREIYENNLLQKCNENFCANINRQILPEVIEKQSFTSEQTEENVPTNNRNAITDTFVNKESNNAKLKIKSKKVKNKKECKRVRKAPKLNIPKAEVLQEVTPELNAECSVALCVVNQPEENEVPIQQMIQSNLQTIQNFNEMCVNDHEITEQDTSATNATGITDSNSDTKEQSIEAVIETVPLAEEEPPAARNESQIETQTYQHHPPHLQLCPKTGLFLPTIICESDNDGETSVVATEGACDVSTFNTNFLSKDILVDLADCVDDDHCHNAGEKMPTLNEHFTTHNLDADTKNLKDLLDDADLMQHCSDNGNSDADIIDSIVKRSCENNLIQEAETLKEAVTPATFNTTQVEEVARKDLITDVIPQHIIDEAVRESPKCLSFNEAGEIEGLNGELFQSNSFMDTYEKESSVEEVTLSDDGKKTESTEVTALSSPLALKEKLTDDVIHDEAPKDLSYKKREEVCPPSESRSQCAVTSSSDVVKSPQQGELPAIETTSEAIKNLILEQFIKLNAFNAVSNPVAKQQSEPINLGKPQRDLTTNNDCNDYATSTNFIETVVIDDNSDEEPMKKRVRTNVKINKNSIIEESTQATIQAPILIDKDPDPLTQLQLLIRNTQWKVPDPILVPKDRLRAVLASPAREIPLLITTRPELRLPEAFAYPEIIQNPNILVISMAQLEAILKNEMEIEKNKQQQQSSLTEKVHEMQTEPAKKPNLMPCSNKPFIEPKIVKVKEQPMNPQPPPPKCSHVETNLASDINAATLAVLNQMLWLPYFGQLSQEFLKTIKNPLGVQNKYAGLLPPIYNHHLGLQHMDEMYKNYLKQMTALKHLSAEASVNNAMPNFPLPLGAFQPSMEATVFQKMLQHQLANFLNINPLSTATETPLQRGGVVKSPVPAVAPNVEHMLAVDEKKTKSATTTTPTTNLSGVAADVAERTFRQNNNHSHNNSSNNVTISCDNAMTESVNYNKYACVQKHEVDSKPRLTCKSLSNLLEPESIPSSPAVPLVNLTTDHMRSASNELVNANSQINNIINKEITSVSSGAPAPVEVMPFKTAKLNKASNGSLNVPHELVKQRKRAMNYAETTVASSPSLAAATAAAVLENQSASRHVVSDNLNVEPNQALWHPLFGSNAKTGYSSPWQWTTVTATGE